MPKRLRRRLPGRRRTGLRPTGNRAVSPPALRRSLSGPPDEGGRPAAALPPPNCANHGLKSGCEPARQGPSAATGPTLQGSRPWKGRARPANEPSGTKHRAFIRPILSARPLPHWPVAAYDGRDAIRGPIQRELIEASNGCPYRRAEQPESCSDDGCQASATREADEATSL